MKTVSLLQAFLFVFAFTFITFAQESYFGIGEGTVFVQPEPAQGNSEGTEYNLQEEEFVPDLTKEYTISFDSEVNELKVEEIEFTTQEILPFHTGTEIIEFEGMNYDNENPDLNLADFYYSMILESRTYGWAWYLNYNWTDFLDKLTTLGSQGYRIENIDTYGRYVFDYGGTWTNDSQGWHWVLNYSNLNDFMAILNGWPNGTPRKRPIDFAIHPSGSQLLYGAVAKADNLGFGWLFNENNLNDFITWINTQYSNSRRLVEIELYRDANGSQLIGGISEDAGYGQQVWINLSWNEFITYNNQLIGQGYRLVDFDKYYVGGNLYYAGLWNDDNIGGAWNVNDNNVTNFENTITGYINNGYKPIMVDVFDGDWVVSVKDDYQLTNFLLKQNYPNPFNPSTKIKYEMPELTFVILKVYDVLGNEVAILANEEKPAGSYEVEFDAKNFPSGIYFYKLQSGDFIETKKMVLLR